MFRISMDESKEMEEKLREAASLGDVAALKKIITINNVNVNSQNAMNGRLDTSYNYKPRSQLVIEKFVKTALHWGAKRNYKAVVEYLLEQGAHSDLADKDGKTAAQLTTSEDIYSLLGGTGKIQVSEDCLPILPNYLTNPPFPYLLDRQTVQKHQLMNTSVGDISYQSARMNSHPSLPTDNELVLKARLAHCDDPDFIEVELARSHLRYDALLNLLCAELGVDKQLVSRIRKLPDTIIRKDKDVARLQDFQEVELVLTNKAISASSRVYSGLSKKDSLTNEQILY